MIIEAFLNFNPATIPYHVAVVPVWQTLKSIDITISDGRTCLLEIVPDEPGIVSYRIQSSENKNGDEMFAISFNALGIAGDVPIKRQYSDLDTGE
ncbi:MAG: hypothetical protein IKE00_01250 [Oscillospiraceae bacterium]|nr:hypothetical protein [Oscillospiraceae bacterium]